METLLLLALLVGASLGVLIALWIDGRSLGQRIQTANQDKQRLAQQAKKTHKALRTTEKALRSSRKQIRQLNANLNQAQNMTAQRTAEASELEQQLADATADVNRVQGNLNRVTEHMGQLESNVTQLQDALETAHGDNEDLAEQLATLQLENKQLNEENVDAHQEIVANEVEMRHLREKLAEFARLTEKAVQLEAEKQRLCGRLEIAESRISDLKMQLDKTMVQLADAHKMRHELAETRMQLETAESQIDQLQVRLNGVQTKLANTGGQRLQIIRGIGPTYARRLHEMGIHTVADLAKLTPERVVEIVKLRSWQKQDPTKWIEEAKQLAAPPAEEAEE